MTSLDQAPEQATAETMAPRAARPWRRLLLALALLVVLTLIAVWLQRRTIAREFVDRELRRRGVPAQYRIEQLSPWRQRLTQVVIGDPRDPDLVADWIELGTSLSPWRAEVLELRAGKLRIKGRLIGSRLSLGTIDRLLPAPSGKPFTLPHVRLDVGDAMLRLKSEYGAVDVAVAGRGMLDDGFAGTARLASAGLNLGSCAASRVAGAFDLRIRRAAPALTGTLAAARLHCADVRLEAPKAALQAKLGAGLDSWIGTADLQLRKIAAGPRNAAALGGRVSFGGSARGTQGRLALRSQRFEAPELAGVGLQLAGDYRIAPPRLEYRGTLVATTARLPRRLIAQSAAAAAAARGSPLGPVATRLAQSAAAAAAAFDASADVSVAASPDGLTYAMPRLAIVAGSGARLTFDRGRGLSGDSVGAPQLDGTLAIRGGGLPDALVRLSQQSGGRLHGMGFVRPYAAGDARLALSRIAFTIGADGGAAQAVATLSGPVGSGRIEDLSLPLDARWRDGRVALNPRCTSIRYQRLAIGGAVLAPTSATACPIGAAMVELSPAGTSGGIRLAGPRLTGRIGSSPLSFAAADARVELAGRRFSLTDAQVRVGAGRVTRLDLGRLDGSFGNRLGGRFAGLGGQIGAVPLVISGATGNWQVQDGGLALTGKLQLSDAATPARFHPLISDDARLQLAGNAITASAGLQSPAGVSVARTEIRHDLGSGRGSAAITVPGLRFAEGGLQPSDLTPLTFGVIADVSGVVEGSGMIAWSPEGVTSTGRFGTRGVDLAAAFGPVRGLATELQFTDLLNLRTAPGQIATTAEINPGVPVRNGQIRFRLLDSQRVAVEGARWPFAGGELVLEPTILDFSERRERRMTFQVIGADAALFLKEMEFDNLDATGTFDGTLPMIFDEKGGRIEGGSLRARAGGSIAYVGELSQRDLGVWGNMAFQALKSLNYRSLTIAMNGPLAGDMVTEIRFSGVSQGKGAKSNFLLRRLAKLPFVFNVRVSAPFKQLLDSVQSWYDPNRLIERNLPALLEEQERSGGKPGGTPPVQPRESDTVRRKEP
ncbi:YdbH domain-containing protein [Sphingomonas psychrotolerans]|uniref:YdbH domain-containing protein n=1 Tax=Sphingomonas psychrotolerans TaxID=1327635 RepID=A0ABU3N7M9_9SPHN|nr:YdbH domain-containing protein [Sphingomonas psychrotolerans]MDT8759335.1 YdbH domain-containing protein [Sphingomonas psychrotolerans]